MGTAINWNLHLLKRIKIMLILLYWQKICNQKTNSSSTYLVDLKSLKSNSHGVCILHFQLQIWCHFRFSPVCSPLCVLDPPTFPSGFFFHLSNFACVKFSMASWRPCVKFWCKNMFRQFFDHELSYRRAPRTRWSLNYFVLRDLHLLLVDMKIFLAICSLF